MSVTESWSFVERSHTNSNLQKSKNKGLYKRILFYTNVYFL